MECEENKVHFFSSNENYTKDSLDDEGILKPELGNYIGSLTVETEYTL